MLRSQTHNNHNQLIKQSGEKFCKIDLIKAYLQLELHKKSLVSNQTGKWNIRKLIENSLATIPNIQGKQCNGK